MPKLTKRIVESTTVQDKDVVLWDSEVKGFCCKITPAGKRVYLLVCYSQPACWCKIEPKRGGNLPMKSSNFSQLKDLRRRRRLSHLNIILIALFRKLLTTRMLKETKQLILYVSL